MEHLIKGFIEKYEEIIGSVVAVASFAMLGWLSVRFELFRKLRGPATAPPGRPTPRAAGRKAGRSVNQAAAPPELTPGEGVRLAARCVGAM